MIHNAITKFAQLADSYRRALGESQGFSGLERASETLQPTLDLWSRPEWAWLRGEILAFGQQSVAAVVGQAGFGALWVPATAGFLATVTRARFYTAGVADTYELRLDGFAVAAAGGAIAASGPFDGRSRAYAGTGQQTVTQFRQGTSAAAFGTLAEHYVNVANTFLDLPLNIVLPPGCGMHIQCATVNTIFRIALNWIERPLLPGEGIGQG